MKCGHNIVDEITQRREVNMNLFTLFSAQLVDQVMMGTGFPKSFVIVMSDHELQNTSSFNVITSDIFINIVILFSKEV